MPWSIVSITLDILEVGARGDGVADLEGTVPYCLPAETVEAEPLDKRGDGIACDLLEVLAPSRHREAPPCPHFGTCGGCAPSTGGATSTRVEKDLIAKALAQRGVKAPRFEAPVTCEPGERRRRADIVLRREGKRASCWLP